MKAPVVASRIRILVSALVIAALAACTIQLSPAYDPELVSGLNRTNEEALTLLSAVENGAKASTFPTHEGNYNEILGKLGALQIRANARVVPPLSEKAIERLGSLVSVSDLCVDAASCVNPSPTSIGEAITTMTEMKEVHQDRGLTAGTVALFKNAYVISIEQALAVENVLKRD